MSNTDRSAQRHSAIAARTGEHVSKGRDSGASSERPQEFCANPRCRAKLRPGGRRPKDPTLPRYCSNYDCRRMRDAEDYARRVGLERVDAQTQCVKCEDPLPPRKIRRGDPTDGRRWCRKYACQRHRSEVLAAEANAASSLAAAAGAVGGDATTAAVAADMARFVEYAENPLMVRPCPECGLENAVQDFIHPVRTPEGVAACRAMGSIGVKRLLARGQWPEFFAEEA